MLDCRIVLGSFGFIAMMTVACSGSAPNQHPSLPTAEPTPTMAVQAGHETNEAIETEVPIVTPEPVDDGPIPSFVNGAPGLHISEATARHRGFSLLDLGDDWTPTIFREHSELGERGTQPFRPRFIALANENRRLLREEPGSKNLELFGIFPTLHVIRQRLEQTERHTCHDQIDDRPLEALNDSLRPAYRIERQRRRVRQARALRRRLERIAQRRGVENIDSLSDHPRHGPMVERLSRLEVVVNAIRAAQAHLRCEGILSRRAQDGVLDARTGAALRTWQRRHMIISLGGRLDAVTQRSLTLDSRELDFLSLLRVLRERVVAASGLIEDGSASNQWGEVVGRQIDLDDEFHWVERLDPLPNGAADLIAVATDQAARALGWQDPATALAWLQTNAAEREGQRLVAVELPAAPEYHSDHMELRVEIDRGDIWYDFPYTESGRHRRMPVRNRPLFVVYTRFRGQDIPLVRWNTTIGGWQAETNPEGGVGLRYKNSDVGPRIWRDMIAGPAWLPPPNTPDNELVRRRRGEWQVNTSITGPGYDSAYGLAMIIHHEHRRPNTDREVFWDNGIRTHGSVNYRSILRGYSHGCHRLFNHLAVRLNSFVLQHRRHHVHGRMPARYRREFQIEDEDGEVLEPLTLEINARGFRFELTPPIPVNVLEGRIQGEILRPPEGFFPTREELQAAVEDESANQDTTPSAESTDIRSND